MESHDCPVVAAKPDAKYTYAIKFYEPEGTMDERDRQWMRAMAEDVAAIREALDRMAAPQWVKDGMGVPVYDYTKLTDMERKTLEKYAPEWLATHSWPHKPTDASGCGHPDCADPWKPCHCGHPPPKPTPAPPGLVEVVGRVVRNGIDWPRVGDHRDLWDELKAAYAEATCGPKAAPPGLVEAVEDFIGEWALPVDIPDDTSCRLDAIKLKRLCEAYRRAKPEAEAWEKIEAALRAVSIYERGGDYWLHVEATQQGDVCLGRHGPIVNAAIEGWSRVRSEALTKLKEARDA
jgi:hypothetical protein